MDVPDWLDQRILAAVSRRGRRLLTYDELIEEGASPQEILGRVRRGCWQRVHHAVYLAGTGELTWQEEILAGVLAGGDSAAAAGLSGGRLWDLGNFGGPIVVMLSSETTVSAKGVRAYRTQRTVPRTKRQGVPVVCIEEVLLGMASALTPRQVHQAFTTAWRRNDTSPKQVLDYIDRNGGRGVRGSRRLRTVAAVYADAARGPGSEAEADFLFDFCAELDKRGIERPELQLTIDVRGGREKVVPDTAWPVRRKVIEMMGLAAHGDYERQADDVERAAAIRGAGWDLEEVTPKQMRERRERTIERLIEFLERPNAVWPPAA